MSIKWPIMAVCGIIVMLFGLWGRCWLVSLFQGTIYVYAAVTTSLLITTGGWMMIFRKALCQY